MDNLASVHDIYRAFGQGDVAAIIERLAPDVVWEEDAVDHGVPWLNPGRGREHVLSFFGVVGSQLDIRHFEVERLFQSDDQVIASIRIEALVRPTQKSFRDRELHLWTFDPKGQVSAFRHVLDTHQHYLASR